MRLLLVEDDPMLLRPLAKALEAAGHTVIGQAGSVAAALTEIAEKSFDIAVLDANLRRQNAEPVAAALKAKAIPFIVVTGYDAGQLDGAFAGAPYLSKPFAVEALLAPLNSLKR